MIEPEKLKAIAHHISYEIEMLNFSADKLKNGGLNQFEINSFLEVFNLHARNLLDFLHPLSNPKPDDVLARHFFDDPEAFQSKLPEIKNREQIRTRIAKEMVHLTYGRIGITREDKQWQVEKIRQEIDTALAIFFDLLSDEQKKWFYVIVNQ